MAGEWKRVGRVVFLAAVLGAVLFLFWQGRDTEPSRKEERLSRPVAVPTQVADIPATTVVELSDPEVSEPSVVPDGPAAAPKEASEPGEPSGASIEGVVIDELGQPLLNMFVSYGGIRRTDVDEAGHFRIEGLKPGAYTLYPVSLTGHGFNNSLSGVEVRLAEGQRATGVRLVYARESESTVSGRITNKRGEPVQGATVNADCSPGGVRARMESDIDGLYSLDLRAEVACGISVAHSDYTSQRREDVAAGTPNVNFVLEGRGRVEGRVIDARTRQPITQFEVSHGPREVGRPLDFHIVRAVNNSDGEFALDGVEAGDAYIYALAEGYAPGRVAVDRVRPDESVLGVLIALSPGAAIEGIVVDMQDNPVPKARIELMDQQDRFLSLRAWGEGDGIATESGENGRFTLTHLDSGFTLLLAKHPNFPETAVPVHLLPNQTTSLRVKMTGPALVEGTVMVNGAPMGYQSITILSNGGKRRALTETGPEGQFQYGIMEEGAITVTATAGRGDFQISDTRSATARPGYTTTVDFDFNIPMASIEGTVTRAGTPVSGAEVHVQDATLIAGTLWPEKAITDTKGEFRIPDVFPGTVKVQAALPDDNETHKSRVEQEATLAPGETVSVNININGE